MLSSHINFHTKYQQYIIDKSGEKRIFPEENNNIFVQYCYAGGPYDFQERFALLGKILASQLEQQLKLLRFPMKADGPTYGDFELQICFATKKNSKKSFCFVCVFALFRKQAKASTVGWKQKQVEKYPRRFNKS